MNAPALNRIVGHAIATLPDSLAARKAVLKDILKVIPPCHKLRKQITQMIQWIEAHEQHQLNLSLDFTKAADPKHDGDHQHN